MVTSTVAAGSVVDLVPRCGNGAWFQRGGMIPGHAMELLTMGSAWQLDNLRGWRESDRKLRCFKCTCQYQDMFVQDNSLVLYVCIYIYISLHNHILCISSVQILGGSFHRSSLANDLGPSSVFMQGPRPPFAVLYPQTIQSPWSNIGCHELEPQK